MTRDETLIAVAKLLTAQAGGNWQRHPDARQLRVQDRRKKQADEILRLIEDAMDDFKWKRS